MVTTIIPIYAGGQGIASDGVYRYTNGYTGIWKLSLDWLTSIAYNANAGAQTGLVHPHMGGATYYDGKLYIACVEMLTQQTDPKSHIGIWDATDLSFIESIDISAQGFDASACAADPGRNTLWVSSFYSPPPYDVFKYDLTTFEYLGYITLTPLPTRLLGEVGSHVQGVAYYANKLYFSYSPSGVINGVAGTGVVKTDMTGSKIKDILPVIFGRCEGQGLFVDSNGGVWVLIDMTDTGAKVVRMYDTPIVEEYTTVTGGENQSITLPVGWNV